MSIQFRCQHCGARLSIASRKAGAQVRCPGCNEEIRVPQANPPVSPPPPQLKPTEPAKQPAKEQQEREPEKAKQAEPVSALGGPGDRVALPDDFFDFESEEDAPSASVPDEEAWLSQSLDVSEYSGDEDAGRTDEGVLEEDVPPSPAGGAAPRPELESDLNPFQIQLRRANIDDDMDLTPMVDVVFQLLIFFMVTASFALHKTIQTPTPESDQKGATQSIQTLDELEGVAILVRIDAQNEIFIDDDPLSDGMHVSDALRDKMRQEQKSEVIINADSAAWHRTVVRVVDAANEVGMQKIRLATRSGADE